jgi:hypothetical protein
MTLKLLTSQPFRLTEQFKPLPAQFCITRYGLIANAQLLIYSGNYNRIKGLLGKQEVHALFAYRIKTAAN